jgi:hypothetical protein
MYDLPRPAKGRDCSDDGSPPKCIRPLASGLRLQPGHDEIRVYRSHIVVRAEARFFVQGLRSADQLIRHHSPEPRFRRPSGSGGRRILTFVECPRPRDDRPSCSGDLGG